MPPRRSCYYQGANTVFRSIYRLDYIIYTHILTEMLIHDRKTSESYANQEYRNDSRRGTSEIDR